MKKRSTVYVDYQRRAREFDVDDMVIPLYAPVETAGRVTAVYPAIGMVDVTFSQGTSRYPVEDLVKLNAGSTWVSPPHANTIPGGAGSVSVPGGPYPPRKQAKRNAPLRMSRDQMVGRVVQAHVKKALYWDSPDRKYRATQCEQTDGSFTCPRCLEPVVMKPAIYKRENGVSLRLLGCPSCMFLIKTKDIKGHPDGYE